MREAMTSDYKELTVSIHVNGQLKGSGTLLWSDNKTKLYCITACHCVTDKNTENCNLEIGIQRNGKSLACEEILKDESVDIAIYSVKIDEFTRDTPKVDIAYLSGKPDRCVIVGFPNAADGEMMILPFQYTTRQSEVLKLNIVSMPEHNNMPFDQLKGISGGGCYEEIGYKPHLVGIEFKTSANGFAFGQVECVPVEVINRLISESGQPTLGDIIPSYVSRRFKNYDLVSSKINDGSFENDWVDIKSSDAIKKIVNDFFILPETSNKPNIIFICGPSGMGKTRSVLNTCMEHGAKFSLYYDSYLSFRSDSQGLIDYAMTNQVKLTVVIDDVSFDDWQACNGSFKQYNDFLSLIMIGVIPTKLSQKTKLDGFHHILPSNTDDINKIVQLIDFELSDEQSNSIARLCAHDIRFAILIAKIIKDDKEKYFIDNNVTVSVSQLFSNYQSAEKILKRTFDLHNDQNRSIDLYSYYEKLSLFIDIGFSGSLKNELDSFSKYFSLTASNFKDAIDHIEEVNLGVKRANVFEIMPRALARMAFEQSGWKLVRDDIDNFMNAIPTAVMKKRFYDRVLECSEALGKEVQEALASWFRVTHMADPDLENIFNPKEAEDITMYVERYPDDSLQWLSRVITKLGPEDFATINFWGNQGRRYYVWMCEHLANFQEYFFICEKIVYHLALHETEEGISNNSQGVWSGWYSYDAANTEVSFYDRFDHLLNKSCNCTSPEISLIEQAYNVVLTDSSIRWMPPKLIGNRVTPPNWTPKSIDETIKIKEYILKGISENWEKFCEELKSRLITTMVEHVNFFSDCFDAALLELYLETMSALSQNGAIIKRRLSVSLEKQIGYLQIQYDPKIELVSIYKSVMERCLENLKEKSLDGKLRLYLSRETWSYGYADNPEERQQNDCQSLCKELMHIPDKIAVLEGCLNDVEVKESAAEYLGKMISSLDESFELVPWVLESIREGWYSPFCRGYCDGVYRMNSQLPPEFIDVLDQAIESNPEFSFWATLLFDISSNGARRLGKLIVKPIPLYGMRYLRQKGWLQFISMRQLLDMIKK